MFENRAEYRQLISGKGLTPFNITVRETNLLIHADRDLTEEAMKAVLKYRGFLEAFIQTCPEFATTLAPWETPIPAHEMIRRMCSESAVAGVGPMASVAGAVAEYTGKALREFSKNIIVENGGDIYLDISGEMTVGIFAGTSPLSMKIGLQFQDIRAPFSICTSSGTIGHSLSMGESDAVCVVADSAILADAAATAIGNHVKAGSDLNTAVDFGKNITGVKGIVIIVGSKIGMWGDINIVRLKNT